MLWYKWFLKLKCPQTPLFIKKSYAIFYGKVRMNSECFLTYFMLNVFSLTLCWMFSHLLYVECFLTYFMFGKRSDTIPLKSFKSSTRNFGTFTSRMARKAISSCRRIIQTLQYANCVLYIGFCHDKMVW